MNIRDFLGERAFRAFAEGARRSMFAGQPISTMSTDELLALVGWMQKNADTLLYMRQEASKSAGSPP